MLLALAALVASSPASAEGFTRPDCAAYNDGRARPEARCFRDYRKQVRQTNFQALQKTGLMFNYMARPDIGADPAAKRMFSNKVEGTFTLKFSVKPDGTVYDVKVAEISSEGVRPMVKVMTETIGQWTFVPTEKGALDVPYTFVALYPKDDKPKKPWESEND